MTGVAALQKEIYDEFKESTGEVKDFKIRKLLTHFSEVKRRRLRILDVGCGDGHLLWSFTESHECVGIDISEKPLERARNRGIETYAIDLESGRFPFPSDYFDIAVCSEVIEHLVNPDIMLCEINRILKKGGHLLLTFPNVNHPFSLLVQIFLDLPPMHSARYKSPHIRDYTLKMAKWLLHEFGFNTVKAIGSHVYPSENRLSQWLAERFPRVGEKIIVIGRKARNSPENTHREKVVWSEREFLRTHKSSR